MKTAVIYQSHYGSTETYARWLAEDLGAGLFQADRVKQADLQQYDTIVYGGGLYAGGVNGIALLTKYLDTFRDKALYLFTVGVSDITDQDNIKAIRGGLEQKLPPALWEKVHIYHLRGGILYSKMSFLHRMMINMMIKALRQNPENERSSYERDILQSADHDTDFTDRAALAPLVADIRAGEKPR